MLFLFEKLYLNTVISQKVIHEVIKQSSKVSWLLTASLQPPSMTYKLLHLWQKDTLIFCLSQNSQLWCSRWQNIKKPLSFLRESEKQQFISNRTMVNPEEIAAWWLNLKATSVKHNETGSRSPCMRPRSDPPNFGPIERGEKQTNNID